MIQFKFTQCPCCHHSKPISFGRKISMGLWSEEKCTFCQCRLREHRIIATIVYMVGWLLFPFGFVAGLEVFQLFFSSEFGLSFGYFIVGEFLGMVGAGFLMLWMAYALVPLVKVNNGGSNV